MSQYQVKLVTPSKPINIWVDGSDYHGRFCVHHDVQDRWKVTHVPTGFCVRSVLGKEAATKLALALSQQVPDHKDDRFGYACRETMAAIRTVMNATRLTKAIE